MRTVLALTTTSWGLFMSLAPLLQVRVILRRHTSVGVSIGWISVLLIGFMLWLWYGLATSDPPLVITNSVSCAVTAATLTVVLLYRPRPSLIGSHAGSHRSERPFRNPDEHEQWAETSSEVTD